MNNSSVIRLVLLIIVFAILVAYLVAFLSSQSTGSCTYNLNSGSCECGITTKKTCDQVSGNFEKFLDCDDNAKKNCKLIPRSGST